MWSFVIVIRCTLPILCVVLMDYKVFPYYDM